MTQPPLVYFGYEPDGKAKIYIRCLLFCTASKGLIVETMYANIIHDGVTSRFGFWGHGEAGKLTFGGVFVGQNGCALDNHFVLSQTEHHTFNDGQNELEIFAKVIGKHAAVPLIKISLTLPETALFQVADAGIFYELNPEDFQYNIAPRNRRIIPQ